jgi:hypothetical protein
MTQKMSNDDLEKKIEDANSRWEKTVSVPEEVDWHGFYAYGDAPAAIGGGFGSFIWFSHRSEMLDFIKHVLPYSPPGRSDLDWEKVAHETSDIIDQMNQKQIDDKTGISQLNTALASFSQIEWMGTFGDLLGGEHHYAKNVREEFSSMLESADGETSAPIKDDAIEDFKEFLSTWGA